MQLVPPGIVAAVRVSQRELICELPIQQAHIAKHVVRRVLDNVLEVQCRVHKQPLKWSAPKGVEIDKSIEDTVVWALAWAKENNMEVFCIQTGYSALHTFLRSPRLSADVLAGAQQSLILDFEYIDSVRRPIVSEPVFSYLGVPVITNPLLMSDQWFPVFLPKVAVDKGRPS